MESYPSNPSDLSLKFDSSSDGNQVSVDVLVRFLEGVQNAIWGLAKASTSRAIENPARVRLEKNLRDEFTIQCTAAEPGSFLLRLVVGTTAFVPSDKAIDLEPVTPTQILRQYMEFVSAVSHKNETAMVKAVPDSFWRARLVRESLRYLPKQDETWWVDLQTNFDTKTSIRFDRRYRAISQKLLDRGESDSEQVTSFIARIDSVDFLKEQVHVYYEPTNKKLKLNYQFDAEDSLVESRRRLVEIKALCNLDVDGHPTLVKEVRLITPHDLSPLVFSIVIDEDRQFEIEPKLVLEPKNDEDSKGDLLVVEESSLNLCVCAKTRSELENEVNSTLIFLWDNYAVESDLKMTKDAIRLKNAILARMKRVG